MQDVDIILYHAKLVGEVLKKDYLAISVY